MPSFLQSRGPPATVAPVGSSRVTAVEVNEAGNDYDLFDPKPSVDGPTPVVDALVVSIQDLPDRRLGELGPRLLAPRREQRAALRPKHHVLEHRAVRQQVKRLEDDSDIAAPHGGKLVNLLANEQRAALLKEISLNLPDIALNARQLCDLELLANGAFSPLTGFMTRSDYESVVDRDYPVVMGILVISSLLFMIGNILSDICVALVDPRVKFE